MSTGTLSYRYAAPSALQRGDHPGLALRTSGGTCLAGDLEHPTFFSGRLRHGSVTAAGVLAVADVATARYFERAAAGTRDPIVSSDGERLRFESFSGCCGVYARLDVQPEGLDGDVLDRGTTNVDVNPPLRRALGPVAAGASDLRLDVGDAHLTATTGAGSVVERQVPLPGRWVRGLAETQVLTAAFDLIAEVGAAEAVRFLRSLGGAPGTVWAVSSGRSLRLTSRAAAGALCLPAPRRLASWAPLLRHAVALRAYGPRVLAGHAPTASAWELVLPAHRAWLVLSPAPDRGFSGEGGLLSALAGADEGQVEDDTELVEALLAFEPAVEVADVAGRSGLPPDRVRAALTRLGASGQIGYDLAEAAWFHRALPYDAAAAERDNPRLGAARSLVAGGCVRIDPEDAGSAAARTATVVVDDHRHLVRFHEGRGTCTCVWYARYRGGRGPCKHVLAVAMVLSAQWEGVTWR